MVDVTVIGPGDSLPPATGSRAVAVDPDTGCVMGVVLEDDRRVCAMCPKAAPRWMHEALHAVRAEVVYVSPRPNLRFERGSQSNYADVQVPACTAGEAVHFSATYSGPEYESPEVVLTLPIRHSNGCFVYAAASCMVRCGGGCVWEAGEPVASRMTDMTPADEETTKRHLREAMRRFATTGSKDALAAARHLVGHVMRKAADKAPDLDDGGQHDAAEFLLRLLEALECEVRSSVAGEALRWEIPSARLAFEEVGGTQPPAAGAVGVVMHTGGAGGGHYTAYARGKDGWEALHESGAQRVTSPAGVPKIVFYKTF